MYDLDISTTTGISQIRDRDMSYVCSARWVQPSIHSLISIEILGRNQIQYYQ